MGQLDDYSLIDTVNYGFLVGVLATLYEAGDEDDLDISAIFFTVLMFPIFVIGTSLVSMKSTSYNDGEESEEMKLYRLGARPGPGNRFYWPPTSYINGRGEIAHFDWSGVLGSRWGRWTISQMEEEYRQVVPLWKWLQLAKTLSPFVDPSRNPIQRPPVLWYRDNPPNIVTGRREFMLFDTELQPNRRIPPGVGMPYPEHLQKEFLLNNALIVDEFNNVPGTTVVWPYSWYLHFTNSGMKFD